ncbi:ABC transporter substrate-binding protein [Anaerotardibacter muris]|uniref:ABC transporter substrate-binding protein n=1 Tax=Anaerotardibacter muris TaxID=2941505 RepID=UPI00203DD8EE|nr:ABC transporter substrate-binding protein [Anaerotardibacter muris]
MKAVSRRNFLQLSGMGALTLAIGSMLPGCSSGGLTAQPGVGLNGESQVVVTMTPSSEPAAGFNPLYSWGCGEHVHEPLIQSTLFTTDTELNFVNDLATSYECSADSLTWTFHIRDDVKFTDGEPLRASDVAFTILGIRDNEAAEADLSMVADAKATDDTTCVVTLTKPFNAFLYTLAVVGIVPEHAYSDSYGEHPIGSGRYMLEQWDKGQQVILKANPDYYGEAPKIERVVVLFMEEDASMAAAQSGDADVAYTAATLANSADISGYELLVCKSVDSRGISLPSVAPGGTKKDGTETYATGNAVTSSLGLRRAINAGVDRHAMIANVLEGYGTPAYSVSDGMPWASTAMEVSFDQNQARSHMEADGWKLGEDGIYAKGDQRARFDLYYAASDSVRQALANEFANQMAQIGIEVQPVGAGWDEIYPHEYDTPVLWGWGANSPVELYTLHYGTSAGNYAVYENAAIDSHLDAALAASSVEASYPQWQAAAWDGSEGFAPEGGAPWVWLANVDHLYFKRDGLDVAQQKPHPHGHGWSLVNNVDQWSWQ